MKAWLVYSSGQAIVVIDAAALLVIVWATAEACVAVARNVYAHRSNEVLRAIWLRCARWLVAALSLQLAADIVETSVSTGWETATWTPCVPVSTLAMSPPKSDSS